MASADQVTHNYGGEPREVRLKMEPRGDELELERGNLERLVRNIRKGEARVHAQANLITRIRAAGGDSGDADCLLEIFQRALEGQQIERDEVKMRLVRLGAGQEQASRPSGHSGNDEHEQERVDALERTGRLSPRERQVLEGLIAGKPNKVIAFDLNISPRTVEIYRANVMHKFQVASLSKLLQLAMLANESVVDHSGRSEGVTKMGKAGA
jgi:DNA-binding NarL/FixJ family response regulator